jgi:hypothetical protein
MYLLRMKIYCDNYIDICNEETYMKMVEHFIYTKNSIYKLYKKHFFEIDLDISNEVLNYKNKVYLLEDDSSKINKKKLLTHIPFYHYYVEKEIHKYIVNDNVTLIKEYHNGKFETQYYDVNNYDIGIFEVLCSIHK